MKQALFLTLLMLITPFVACTSLLETEQKNDILEPEIIDYNAAKIATNPLGWEWVTKDTNAGYVWTREVEVDSYGDTYISGIFRGGSLSIGSHHALNNGGLDVFAAKFSSTGNCIWLTTFGGILNEHVEDMIVDSSGNLYVVGSYDSPQFNVSTTLLNNSGSRDGFVVSMGRNTGAISWGNSVNGPGFDNITGVTLDSTGTLVYSGWTNSTQIIINSTILNNSGDTDFFVLWGHTNGLWDQAKIYGGVGKEQAHDIASDGNGKVMIVAEFSTSSLILDQTSITHGGGVGSDSLVMRVARSGVEWVRKPICNLNDRAWSVDVDSAGNVFVAGELFGNSSSWHYITWGSIQLGVRGWQTSYFVKFSNVGAIGWALGTDLDSSGNYYAKNPSVDIEGSHLLVSANYNRAFRFYSASYSSHWHGTHVNGHPNSVVVELTNTGSVASSSAWFCSGWSTIFDVAWINIQNNNDHIIFPINGVGRSSGSHNVYSDAPATTLSRFQWNNGLSTIQYEHLIGHTDGEYIVDLEPLNSTHNILLGYSERYGQNLRFGSNVIGGFTSSANTYESRIFLATSDYNGTWYDLDQIMIGGRADSTNGHTTDRDWAAMAVGPNGTVWVAFHWQNYLQIPGLTTRSSGSGYIVASWSPTNGWMSADSIGFDNSHYVDVDIAVDPNGDVWFSGYCYGSIFMHGNWYSGANSPNICIAKRDSTSSWNNIYRSNHYYYYNIYLEAMAAHPNGGVVFWAKSGQYNDPSGGSKNVVMRGALVRLFSSNGTMWWMGEPTCSITTSASHTCAWVEGLDVSNSGDIYISGYFEDGMSFSNCCSVNSGGSTDGFLAKFNSSGNWDWSISLGGTSSDEILDVRHIGNGSIAVVGDKVGVISVGLTTLSGAGTGFVAMAADQGTWEWAAQPIGNTYVKQVIQTGNGTIEVAGVLENQNSARTFGLDSLNSSMGDDIFLSRMSADADADGITNNRDNCYQIYNPTQQNYDSDTMGDICDSDDDNDGITDLIDSCPQGVLIWSSNNTTDHDSDGCKDIIEDDDDDNDSIIDTSDYCSSGVLNWTSTGITDYDTDGCKDSNEDLDDDDDTVNDTSDACPKGSLGWISSPITDHDGDGCLDSIEDDDDDDDGINDLYDSCHKGDLNWTSSNQTDNDGDGCLDATEDLNDDDDHFYDYDDSCPNGTVGWYSGSITDYDGDGCKDSDEDLDDDADGVLDVDDNCPKGITGWVTNPTVDYDGDGCHDWNEDTDDDADGISDLTDQCSRTPAGSSPNSNGCASGEIPDGNGGGGSSSVNYTEDNTYVNNTYVNNTYVNNTQVNNTFDNETFQNQSFQNNSYSNETFQNQTYQNNTNLNQTILEGNEIEETNDQMTEQASESFIGTSWVPLVVVALMILMLFIQALHLVKKPAVPIGPPESMLAEQSLFDEIDFTPDIEDIGESEPLVSSDSEISEVENQEPVNESPPTVVENATISDGFEWIEWPEGSGQNYFRAEGTQDDWQSWPVE